MNIPKEHSEMLDRLEYLDMKIKKEGDRVDFDDGLAHEAGEIRQQLVEYYLPVIQRLCSAGLLDVNVENRSVLKKKWKSVSFECGFAYDNGNIVIDAAEPNCWCPVLGSGGHPNIHANAPFEEYARELWRVARRPKASYLDWVKENKVELDKKYADFGRERAEWHAKQAAEQK